MLGGERSRWHVILHEREVRGLAQLRGKDDFQFAVKDIMRGELPTIIASDVTTLLNGGPESR